MPEDQVNLEPESSEEGPLQETDTETESSTESSPEGTATESGEPEVVERTKYDQVVSDYDKLKGEFQATEAELQRELEGYRAEKRRELEAQLADEEAFQKRINEIGLPAAFDERYRLLKMADSHVESVAAEGKAAFDRVKEFATKDAKMSEAEFGQFYAEFSDPNGVAFPGMSPAQAEKAAKGLIRDRYFDRFAKDTQAKAEESAMVKSKRKLGSMAPSTASVGGAKEKSVEEEFIDEVMESEQRSKVDEFFND